MLQAVGASGAARPWPSRANGSRADASEPVPAVDDDRQPSIEAGDRVGPRVLSAMLRALGRCLSSYSATGNTSTSSASRAAPGVELVPLEG